MKTAFVLAFMLCSCTHDIAYQPVQVKVPVMTPCMTAPVQQPDWPLHSVTAASPLFEKVKYALAEIETRKAYETRLQSALAACE